MSEVTMTDIERVRYALSYIPEGYTDCAGYKCRQRNCQACFSDPEPMDSERDAGRAALSRIERELELLSTRFEEYERVVEAVRSFVDFTETGQYRNNEGSKAYMFNRLREALGALGG